MAESAIDYCLQASGITRPVEVLKGLDGKRMAIAWEIPKTGHPVELEVGSDLQPADEQIQYTTSLSIAQPAKTFADVDLCPFFGW